MQWRAAQRGALCLPLCRQRPSFLTLIEPDRLSQRRVFVPANKPVCLQTHTRTTTGGRVYATAVCNYCVCLCQDSCCLFCPFALFFSPHTFCRSPFIHQLPSRTDWDRQQHRDQQRGCSERTQRPLWTKRRQRHLEAQAGKADGWTGVTELCPWLRVLAMHRCNKTF